MMSDMCTCITTVVFLMKDGKEIRSKSCMDDMDVLPTMFAFSDDNGVAMLLNQIKSGNELINAINDRYNGAFIDGICDKGFSAEVLSKLQLDDVEKITITEEQKDGYGESVKTFFYYPETQECSSDEDYQSEFMDNYDGDSENAEAILSMYNMGGMSSEEIAEVLNISVDEVNAVIENADEIDDEDWDEDE